MKYPKAHPTTDDHLRPSLGKALLRGVVVLILIAILTWIGRFKEPEKTVVRNHGLLGWNFSTSEGISSLIVFPDDNNDSNTIETGDRIWLYPPQNPSKILAEGARFGGKRLTVIADSLSLHTLEQLAEMVEPGGFIHLLGRQFASLETLKATIPNYQLEVDTLRDSLISLPVGEDGHALLQSFKNFWRLDIISEGFRLMYTNWREGEWPFSDSTLSMVAFIRPTQDPTPLCADPSLQPTCQTALWSSGSQLGSTATDLFVEDSTRMVLNSTREGAILYRSSDPWELKIKKVSFLKWDGKWE